MSHNFPIRAIWSKRHHILPCKILTCHGPQALSHNSKKKRLFNSQPGIVSVLKYCRVRHLPKPTLEYFKTHVEKKLQKEQVHYFKTDVPIQYTVVQPFEIKTMQH